MINYLNSSTNSRAGPDVRDERKKIDKKLKENETKKQKRKKLTKQSKRQTENQTNRNNCIFA